MADYVAISFILIYTCLHFVCFRRSHQILKRRNPFISDISLNILLRKIVTGTFSVEDGDSFVISKFNFLKQLVIFVFLQCFHGMHARMHNLNALQRRWSVL